MLLLLTTTTITTTRDWIHGGGNSGLGHCTGSTRVFYD